MRFLRLSLVVFNILIFTACSSSKTSTPDTDIVEEIPVYLSMSKISTDSDGDGIYENITIRYFDTEKKLLREESDDDENGIPESSTTNTYDDDGNLVLKQYRGFLEVDYKYAYDASNNLIREERDSGYDGVIESVTYFSYNAANKIIEERRDDDNDGVNEKIIVFTYDASGIFELKQTIDDFPFGSLDYIADSTYTPTGKLETRFINSDGIGGYNSKSFNIYDAEDNLVEEQRDYNADGANDYVIYYNYDADGNLEREERDENGNGSIDITIVYSYQTIPDTFDAENGAGSVVPFEFTYYLPGDIVSFFGRYTYAADGSEAFYETDSDGDGVLDRKEGYHFDSHKNYTESFTDDPYDGAYDEHSIFENFYEPLP